MSSSWIDCLSQKEREELYINFWKYKGMSHEEIRDAKTKTKQKNRRVVE